VVFTSIFSFNANCPIPNFRLQPGYSSFRFHLI
jgi:hypothetical protein